MRIYGDAQSGNCYKIKLLCHNLGIDYQWQHVDILKNENQTPEFLAKNPLGKIPIIELDDGNVITESNAILHFLAFDTSLQPKTQKAITEVLRWQFFEQYTHEPSIAVARFIRHYQNMPAERQTEYQQKLEAGYKALDIMELHLSKQHFFVGDTYSLADISLYAYTHVAEQGGFDLSRYPYINRWLKRVTDQHGYCPMG